MAERKLVCRRCSGYGLVVDRVALTNVVCPDCATPSGTPDLTPGVLEDGGSARVGDLTPPGSDAGLTADPPSLPLCTCGRTGITYEGPQRDCPIHGEAAVTWYLTFGVQYAREPHPAGDWITPDGWVTIVAPSYEEARRVVVGLFGQAWSDLYGIEFGHDYFPRGELLRIEVPS
jgi:hypothetical protein